MGMVKPKKVLKPHIDYIPLGKTDIESMKGDIINHGSYLLLLLLHGGDHYSWTREEIVKVAPKSSLGKDLDKLVEKGILNFSENTYHLNLEYPIFRYLLVEDSTITSPRASWGTIGGNNIYNKNEGVIGGGDKKLEEATDRLFSLVNTLRQQRFDAKPQRKGVIISNTIEEALKNHGEKACTAVVESYFEWEGLNVKFATVQSTFTNFEKKLTIALSKNRDIASKLRDMPETRKGPMWMLYDQIVGNFDVLRKQNMKICFTGGLKDQQIASMAYRLYIKRLCNKKPVEWDDPQGIWESCVGNATKLGGIQSVSEDDLFINGKLHTVPVVTVGVP